MILEFYLIKPLKGLAASKLFLDMETESSKKETVVHYAKKTLVDSVVHFCW